MYVYRLCIVELENVFLLSDGLFAELTAETGVQIVRRAINDDDDSGHGRYSNPAALLLLLLLLLPLLSLQGRY